MTGVYRISGDTGFYIAQFLGERRNAMKNVIIIIGTILLGVVIVNSMILGEGDASLQSAAETVIERGVAQIESVRIGE